MLGVLAATLVVAGAMHFSSPGGTMAPGAPAQAQVNLDEMGKIVEQAKLSPERAYRIGLLADNASGDPFYGGQGGLSQEETGAAAAQELVYSGYIKIGQKIFAVLNGVEYARGDELAEGGYVVQAIDKNSVLLERTDGSTGRKFTKRVALVEDDMDKIRIRVVKKR
ncbi:MAG TPA: hypothetical protein VN419_13060 [Humidesulfovibrio sp.]|uniref:hypothetical protein n=1 Tax=Humidesulfovibrio sp. TaxID=2910988 RepID=UPI002C199FFF|nr:hypothetical protein [Humidesulfovibrio sp.]HWR04927.1 hypothetical protein [Humidesulfovibrio sp.]